MQIDSVEVFHAAFPLREAVAGPNGPLDRLETVFVKMTSGETAGWSEVAPGTAPTLGPEWVGSVYAVLREWMMPAVVGSTIDSADAFEERLAPFEGNRYAKAALDMAWWDLKARLEGKPLWKLLGGTKAAVAVGVEFDRNESIDDFLSDIGRAYAAGFSRVGLKFRPGWEIPMLSAVRRDYPTQTLHIDCVAGMRLRHMDTIHRVDDFGIDLMEQPLAADDLVGHAMIQESVRTPVCLDESVTTPEQAEMALELKSCKFMNLKPARVGGFTAARAIAKACAMEKVACWVGAEPQTAVGLRLGLALAAGENFTYPSDWIDTAALLLDVAPAQPPALAKNEDAGALEAVLWEEPGIGVAPDETVLRDNAVATTKGVR